MEKCKWNHRLRYSFSLTSDFGITSIPLSGYFSVKYIRRIYIQLQVLNQTSSRHSWKSMMFTSGSKRCLRQVQGDVYVRFNAMFTSGSKRCLRQVQSDVYVRFKAMFMSGSKRCLCQVQSDVYVRFKATQINVQLRSYPTRTCW